MDIDSSAFPAMVFLVQIHPEKHNASISYPGHLVVKLLLIAGKCFFSPEATALLCYSRD
jgi:non-ribosomal peptide synthetase component E (peptide arylation enzyme)